MSDIELEKARALALSAQIEDEDDEWEPEKNYAPTLSEMEEAKADVKPTKVEAVAGGWIEGIPFLKDGVAAYEGISDTMKEGGSFEDGYSNYKDNLDDINEDLTNAKEQRPFSSAGGEIAGTVATVAAGGAALKGLGAGSVLTTRGINAVSGVGTGAVQGLSRSRDRGPGDLVVGASLGFAGEVGGHYIGEGVKRTGKYLMDKADDMYAIATRNILGINTVNSSKNFSKYLDQSGMKESEFLSSILTRKMHDSDELVVSLAKDAPDRMMDKVKIYLKQSGKQLERLYKKADDMYDIKVDPEDMKAYIVGDVVNPLLKSDNPGTRASGEQLLKFIQKWAPPSIKQVKKEVGPDGTKLIEELVPSSTQFGASRMHRLQVDVRKHLKDYFKSNNVSEVVQKHYEAKAATSLGDYMDSMIQHHVKEGQEDLYTELVKSRKDFSSMAFVRDTLTESLHRKKEDPIRAIKEAISFKSLLAGGVAAKYVGTPGLLVGPAFSKMINDPNTPVYLSRGMEQIGKTIQQVPGGRIATRLNSAALMSNDKFEEVLYSMVAENNLKAERIPRTTEGARERVQDIRHFLKDHDRELFRDFDLALESENDDALGALLDGMSKSPNASKFFEEGVGFNGKVFTDEDKMMLERQLKSTDMPATQRMEMLENLRGNGVIPDMNTIVKPQPIQHKPRTKKMHNY